MSAFDILRSLAETRTQDAELLPEGHITYGTLREILQKLDQAAILLGQSGAYRRPDAFHHNVVEWLDRNGYDVVDGKRKK